MGKDEFFFRAAPRSSWEDAEGFTRMALTSLSRAYLRNHFTVVDGTTDRIPQREERKRRRDRTRARA